MRRSRAEWLTLCKQLHEALKVGEYTITDWCREMGVRRANMYTIYNEWKRREGLE